MKNRERKMVDLRPKWTPEEEKALREGVAKHGVGKWKIIVNDPQFSHTLCSRSNRNLRDKWRYMNDASRKPKPTIEDQKMSEVETEVEVDSEVEIDSEVKVEVEAEAEVEAEDNESEQLEAAERVAFLIADAENKEKKLAESYKNLQKLIEMKEETYAILKIAREIFDKTLHDYS